MDTDIFNISADEIEEILRIQDDAKISKWSAESYIAEIENSDAKFLGIRNSEKLIGFVLLRKLVGESSETSEAELLNIAIADEFQRRGCGKLLFERCIDELITERVSQIWLEVRESNINAIRFYESFGFERSNIRKNYYSGPVENAVVMKKTL